MVFIHKEIGSNSKMNGVDKNYRKKLSYARKTKFDQDFFSRKAKRVDFLNQLKN